MKIYVPHTQNLGDFFNVMPVISGLSKSADNGLVDLVVADNLYNFKGFRQFIEYQLCIRSLRYRKEVFNMDERSYIHIVYSQEEFRNLTEHPIRPIETMRHEKFVRDNYPQIKFEVDDDFTFRVWSDFYAYEEFRHTLTKVIVGHRWMHNITDPRRSSNLLKSSGLLDDDRFYFLDYNNDLMENAMIIKHNHKPFITTFTGVAVLADLMNVKMKVVYGDDMIQWNNAPIQYSYWKHFYHDRGSDLVSMEELKYSV